MRAGPVGSAWEAAALPWGLLPLAGTGDFSYYKSAFVFYFFSFFNRIPSIVEPQPKSVVNPR